jgi:translocation and assembly module TamB
MRKLAALLLLVAALAAASFALRADDAAADDAERTVLGDLISRVLSTPGSRVQVGAVDGALSSDATIRNIVVSDREGPWLRLDRARLVWTRSALLRRQLLVNTLEIGKFEVLRRPLPSDEAPAAAPGPLLPELPLRVQIDAFELAELSLGEPLLGDAATLSAKGKVKLGPPSEGLDARFETRRLDRPGEIDLSVLFVPQGEKLAVGLQVREPEGGLIARAAHLPGLPPVDLSVDGQGALDAFLAKLHLVAGPTLAANGDVTLNRVADGRRLAIDLSTRVEGLTPEIVAPIFAGGALAQGAVTFRDDGAILFDRVGLETDVARLDLDGAISADRIADLRIAGRALEPSANAPRGDVRIGKLDFDTTMKGPLAAPTLAATLALAQARTGDGAVGSVDARVDVAPAPLPPGAAPGATPSFVFSANARMDGLKLADPALARAVGDAAVIDAAATLSPDGVAQVSRFKLDSPALEASFVGRVGAKEVDGRVDLAAGDLARFSDLAGMTLAGEARGGIDLSGDPGKRFDAKTHLLLSRLATGVAPLDRLIGGKLTIDGGLARLPSGGLALDDLVAKAAYLDARLDGQLAPDQTLLDVAAAVSDLHRFDARMTGRADLKGKVTGALARPAVSATVSIPSGTALGRDVKALTLALTATDVIDAPQATVTLDGAVGGKPTKGAVKLSRSGQTLRVESVDVGVGSVALKGALVADAGRYDGEIALKAGDLDDVSALALTPLGGDLDATITLRSEQGQTVALKGASKRLRLDAVALEGLAVDLVARDVFTRPALAGAARLARATQAGRDLASDIRFDAAQDGRLTLAGRAQGFDVDAAGRLTQTDKGVRLDLATAQARKGGERIALAQPGAVTLSDGAVALDRIAVALGAGRLTLDGRVSPTLDLAVAARAVPLSAASIVAPGLGLSGAFEAQARLAGTPSAPQGDWRVSIVGLSAPATRSNGLPPLKVDASGRLSVGRTSLDAIVAGPGFGPIRASGSAPLDAAGALDLKIDGRLDLALANRQLGADGRRVAGAAVIDARVTGRANAPRIEGGARFDGVTFSDAEYGVRVTNISGRVVGGLDELRIEGVSGATPNGGAVNASGRIGLGAGLPANLRLVARGARLIDSPAASAVADADVAVTGPLAGGALVAGRIAFSRLDVTIPERLPTTSRPLSNVRHVNPPPRVRQALARKAKVARGKSARAAPDYRLDLRIEAPNRVFVRGRGVDAELGGALTLKGAATSPTVIGGFELRRGRFNLAGRRLDFARGKVTFSGALEPQLDFLATYQAPDALVQVSLAGSAVEPDFRFFSDPDLPQDEVLARLLFGKATGGLSATQALQIAMVAAQFSGVGGGDGALDKVRRQLGVDSLDVGVGADGGIGVGVNRAINDRISVGVKAGARPADSGVSVDLDVTRRLRLKGEATADGATGVGIGWEMEY